MPCDNYILSSDSQRIRFLFNTNGGTIYQGYGTDYAKSHEWKYRNGDTKTSVDNLGNFYTDGYITARFLSINKSPSDYLGLNFDTTQGVNSNNLVYVLFFQFYFSLWKNIWKLKKMI